MFWLLVGTLLASMTAAYFTGQQWRTADDAEKRSLRAYVMANQRTITVDNSNFVHARFKIKNSGLTPAYRVATWGCLIIGYFHLGENGISLEMNFPSGPPNDETTLAKSIIGPGDVKELTPFSFCDVKPAIIRALTPDERTRLREGIAAIYIYGEVTYIDAFGSDKFLKYRFFSNDKIGKESGATVEDPRGNDAN